MLTAFKLSALAALSAFSTAADRQRSLSPSSDGLGIGAFDTTLTFTLAAFNTALPDTNTLAHLW